MLRKRFAIRIHRAHLHNTSSLHAQQCLLPQTSCIIFSLFPFLIPFQEISSLNLWPAAEYAQSDKCVRGRTYQTLITSHFTRNPTRANMQNALYEELSLLSPINFHRDHGKLSMLRYHVICERKWYARHSMEPWSFSWKLLQLFGENFSRRPCTTCRAQWLM